MKRFSIFSLIVAILLIGCNTKKNKTKNQIKNVDYSLNQNWIEFQKEGNKEFDVFFVHPTTYPDKKEGMNASIETIESNDFTRQIVEKLAGAFGKTCNIYAPKYKQASIYVLELPVNKRKQYLDIARKDVEDAFKYFLKNINKGRPYIIAGHSQGSNIIKDMLVENPNLAPKNNLVAVYAIGYTITQKDLETMKLSLAVTPTQTSGVITWNTIGKGGKSPTIEPNALCVNPLDWTNGKENQDSSKNIFADINGTKIPHFTSAQIDENGALVIPTPQIIDKLPMLMGKEVYHMYDYDFFYGNLIDNVEKRCNAWKEKQK
ncbi:MAG: DUF3089 domain-containing protein [Tenacibaculum sp.]|nr:DUF3089 domain-containing protein [Tenacibaculum sp.]